MCKVKRVFVEKKPEYAVKAKELFDAGVYVNPVLPPATPPGESLLRTSYMANHTETILDEALDIIERIVKND